MKKEWTIATIEELDVKATQFGLQNPEVPDSEKTQVTIDGVDGWKQEFGEGLS